MMTMAETENVELIVMASGWAEPALDFVAAAFEKDTGHKISISYRYDLESCDVLVMSRRALEEPPEEGGYAGRVEEGRIWVARSAGVGIAVRQGARTYDVSDEQAIVQAIRDCERLLLTENHASGAYMQKYLKTNGLFDEVKAKINYASIGQDLVDRLLRGEGDELMFLPIGRMRATNDARVNILGPLPDSMQMSQDFFAVPMTASAHKGAAWDFSRFCAGPGRSFFVAQGFR